MAGELEKNLKDIESEVQKVLQENPSLEAPLLLAVSKRQPTEKIKQLFELGVTNFGENYLQEALEKKKALQSLPISWHFIGQLQSKKIKEIVGEFDLIQTLSRKVELDKMEQVASQKGLQQKVLIQVNIASEDTKQGVTPDCLGDLVDACLACSSVLLQGLMFFPPLSDDSQETMNWFEKSSELFSYWKKQHPDHFKVLSMGTSQDYLFALRKGSTLLRLGECLMGPRP